jgi:FKBP-type peptidyl-prolyl cis-trans isomerase
VRLSARIAAGLYLAAAATTFAQTPAPAQAPAVSRSDGSYSLGVSIGAQLRNSGLTSDAVALDRVMQGLKEALAGTAEASAAHNEKVNNLIQTARAEAGTRNKATARKFFDENSKKKGVITTKSGLQYRIINAGKGAGPKPTDQVTVHYRGTLLDGTEFDSSYKRGEPATFPVNGVIKGWQEALVLMKPGAKWELFIPPELAYDLDSPPVIPPGSALRFDVELLNVGNPPTAAPSEPPK